MPMIKNCPECGYKTIFKSHLYCSRCGNGLCVVFVRRKLDKQFDEFRNNKEIFPNIEEFLKQKKKLLDKE